MDLDIFRYPDTEIKQPVSGLATTSLPPEEEERRKRDEEEKSLAMRELPKGEEEAEVEKEKILNNLVEKDFIVSFDNFVQTLFDKFEKNEYFDKNKLELHEH